MNVWILNLSDFVVQFAIQELESQHRGQQHAVLPNKRKEKAVVAAY